MKIKKLEEDIIFPSETLVYRKWWEFWKPNIVGVKIGTVLFEKGREYFDAEEATIEDIYDYFHKQWLQD